MKKTLSLLVLFTLSFFCFSTSKTEKKITKQELKNRKAALSAQMYVEKSIKENQDILENYISSLPVEKKVAQLFIENLEGNHDFRSYETYDSILGNGDKTPLIAGGYLFFSYNLCDSVDEQLYFMNSIMEYSKKYNQLSPYLAIDQEGGYVNRLKHLTGGLPSQDYVAKNLSVYEAFDLYENQAKKMKELGFHMNIAPVIEVCTEDNSDFLNGRSFGNAEQTVSYGKVCVFAYENSDIATVIKHFPGNTNTDPHTGLPEITLEYNQLMESIEPFKQILQLHPKAILMSHARTAAVDGKTPACLSKVWISDILRKEYGYDGLIFSDDIFMGALSKNGYSPEKAAILAIEAGVDCIMTSEKRFGKQAKVIYKKAMEDSDFLAKIDKSVLRILKYKLDSNIISYEDLNI